MTGGGAFAYRLATPNGPGAIAVVDVIGEVQRACSALGIDAPPVGAVALRDLGGVDTGLVARWSERHLALTPHGGPFVVTRLLGLLDVAGGERASEDDSALWPEARDRAEARMLWALSRAQSPRAVDLLLDQPRRWRAWDGATPDSEEIRGVSRELDRLIDPPLVVAIGGTNIGKSTLINALAASEVSIVADEPGVTRDHVGALVTFDGLTVRWVDTPGLRDDPDGVEEEAVRLAAAVAGDADLLVLCADGRTDFPTADALERLGIGQQRPTLRVGLRADLGPVSGADLETAAGAGGAGLEAMSLAIRRRLVPDESLAWQGPWAMLGCDPASLQGGGGSPTLACSGR